MASYDALRAYDLSKSHVTKDHWDTSSGSSGLMQLLNRESSPTLGTEDLLQGYSTMPWLRAVSDKIASTVGETSWRLFRTQDAQGRTQQNHRVKYMNGKVNREKEIQEKARLGNLEEIEDHKLLQFLFFANEHLDGVTAMKITQIHLDLVGESYWVLERDGLREPVAWFPLPPQWVKQFPTEDRQSFIVSLPNGKRQEIPKSEVIPFINPSPLNPYDRGSGIGQALGNELATDELSSRFTQTFFHNDAKPSLIIGAQGMSESEARRLDQEWRRQHQGVFQSFRPLFLNRDIDVQQVEQSLESMQFTDLKENLRDTIISVFGCSPEMCGVIENSNRASIDAASFFYSKHTIEPRQEQLRTILQNKLVPMFNDPSLILDFQSIVDEDKQHKLELMQAAPWAYTIDEWRQEAGHDPLPEERGQARMLPLNMVEIGLSQDPPQPENGDQNLQIEEDELTRVEEKLKIKYPKLGRKVVRKLAVKTLNKFKEKKKHEQTSVSNI